MYVLVLLLGALTTVAGLALVVMGIVRDGAFETDITTPGTVAVVGGLILIGLGLAVRELQRIERALAARPMPRPARPAEAPAAAAAAATAAAAAAAAVERPPVPARVSFPPKPKAEPRPQPAPSAAAISPEPAEDAAFERLREKFPTLVRLESVPAVEETDASLLARARAERAEEEVSEVKKVSVAGRAPAPAPARAAPRLDANARQSGAPERPRGSVLETFWPQGQRLRRSAATAPAQVAAPAESAAPAPAPAELAQGGEAAPATHPAVGEPRPAAGEAAARPPTPEPAPVSILKSGVVEGMAYALYSDGSIEAQLPQGRLRFGSITELRHHIESDS